MTTPPELVALIQRERERRIATDRLARFAARVRSCCRPSALVRIVRIASRAFAAS